MDPSTELYAVTLADGRTVHAAAANLQLEGDEAELDEPKEMTERLAQRCAGCGRRPAPGKS